MGDAPTPSPDGNAAVAAPIVDVADELAAPSAVRSTDPPPADPVAVALETGWTMALLCGPLADSNFDRVLPSEDELPVGARVQVELSRLSYLLQRLQTALPWCKPAVANPDLLTGWGDGTGAGAKATLVAQLKTLNTDLLRAFACAGREVGIAYSLGRSLRTTVDPSPSSDPAKDEMSARLLVEFRRSRINKLQNWLRTLAPHFGNGRATVVGASLGWWTYVVEAAFDPEVPGSVRQGRADATGEALHRGLREQGDVWLALLLGAREATDLLTPEGYARAGEAAVDRAARIVRRALMHYWPGFVVLLAALGGVSYLVFTGLGSAASKVFTEIGAVAGSLGITASGIASTVGRLTKEGMGPVYECAKRDAEASAITEIPRVSLTHGAVAALRRAGVPGGYRVGPVAALRRGLARTRLPNEAPSVDGDLMSCTPYPGSRP